MPDILIGLLSIVAILVLIQIGIHVAVALSAVSFIGVAIIRESFDIAGVFLQLAVLDSIARYAFGVIPLFILMGMLVSVSDIGRDTFRVAAQAFRRSRAGLAIATVIANAVFAAVNGTSIASASVFTRIAVPELITAGFRARFAVGVVAGSSVLGMLIPPSLLLILFGIIAETSIGDLFTAGIIPGVVLTVLFIVMILGLSRFAPDRVYEPGRSATVTSEYMTPVELVLAALPVVVLILIVLGGIYGGIFTPTEAGGVGVVATFIITLLRRKLTLKSFVALMIESGRVTAAISILIVAAHMYARMLALSGITAQIEFLVSDLGLGFYGVLLIYLLLLILLGTILDSASIMLIAVPLALPAMEQFGTDVVWFGVLTVVAVEVGLLTPPLGIACFVIKSNLDRRDVSLAEIFRGAIPFWAAMMVMIALLVAVPGLAVWLV